MNRVNRAASMLPPPPTLQDLQWYTRTMWWARANGDHDLACRLARMQQRCKLRIERERRQSAATAVEPVNRRARAPRRQRHQATASTGDSGDGDGSSGDADPDPPRLSPLTPQQTHVIDEVLGLLARALVADVYLARPTTAQEAAP